MQICNRKPRALRDGTPEEALRGGDQGAIEGRRGVAGSEVQRERDSMDGSFIWEGDGSQWTDGDQLLRGGTRGVWISMSVLEVGGNGERWTRRLLHW